MARAPSKSLPPSKPETISGHFAQFATALRYEDIPQDVRERARIVLLDALGCGLAGSGTDELAMIRSAVTAASERTGASALWGTAERAPLPLAALANGAAVHAREMDDFEGCLHSGAVIIPAALGAAISVGASGSDLLTAIVIGYDIARRAMEGAGGNLPLKEKGWHSTSTCGGFGAAAAVGRLLGLDGQRMQWALGYAGSNAGGTWAFIPEGAMSKRVHPGFASQNGVMAAYLANSGVSAPDSIFEADWGGFYPTYTGDQATPQKALEGLGSDFKLRIVGFKPYAACRGTHSSIDAILALRQTEQLKPEMIERVTVRATPMVTKQLGKQQVHTMLDAQFSIPYGVAVALATGGAMLDQYSEEKLQRPEITALAQRIFVEADPAAVRGRHPGVEVRLKDGRVLKQQVDIPRGDRRNPIPEADLRAKFRANAGLALQRDQIEKLENSIAGLADIGNVSELGALLTPRAALA